MFSIAPYHVEIVDSKKQPLDIWNFQPSISLKDVLDGYLKGQINLSHQHETAQAKKTYVLRKLYKGSGHTLAGRYHTGHYGYESEIWDTQTKKPAHKRTKVQADLLPFLFAIYFPKKGGAAPRKRALLLLARHNTMGIRSMVIPRMIDYVSKTYPGVELRVEKIAPTAVVNTLLKEGQVKKIRLVKKTLPKDFASVLAPADKPDFLDLEYVFRLKKSSFFSEVNWISEYIQGKKLAQNVFTIPADFAPDNIKVEIAHGSKSRVIDLGNRGKVSPNVDITDEVEVDASGHPEPESWLAEADSLAGDIFSSWGTDVSFDTEL